MTQTLSHLIMGLASVTSPPSLIPILNPASVISSRARPSSLSFLSGSKYINNFIIH